MKIYSGPINLNKNYSRILIKVLLCLLAQRNGEREGIDWDRKGKRRKEWTETDRGIIKRKREN